MPTKTQVMEGVTRRLPGGGPPLAPSYARPELDPGLGSSRWKAETEAGEPEGARSRDRRYRWLLALADVMAAVLAAVVCIETLGRSDAVTPVALLAIPVVITLAKVLGLYDRDELLLRKTTLDEAPALLQLSGLTALIVWLGQGVVVIGEQGRDQVLAFWAILFLGGLAFRSLARASAWRMAPVERCVVVGEEDAASRARDRIESSDSVHAEVVASVPFEDRRAGGVLAADALAELAATHDVHRLVIAPPSTDHGGTLDLIRAAKALGIKVSVLPRMLEVVGSSVEFDDLDGVGVLGVRRFGLTRSSKGIKRAFDLVGSLVALILLAPVFAALAVMIKLDSRGPVFFRQKRVGRDGRVFRMLKLRTMVSDAEERRDEVAHLNEADGLFKIPDDPRITRVGGVLRRLSMDELPQLLNVLRGEMSLVGPRPLSLEDDIRVEGWYRRRLHLTPGMTGRWQILGSARVPLGEMVKLDYLYVANWSLWTDVKILLRTLPYMAARRGM